MKARIAYPLLFLLPAAMAAAIAGVLAVAGGAGVLWIFVFGDRTWPAAAGTLLMSSGALVAVSAFVALLRAAYAAGRQREPAGVARRHVVIAVAAGVGLPMLALLHQWQVGNIGHHRALADVATTTPQSSVPEDP